MLEIFDMTLELISWVFINRIKNCIHSHSFRDIIIIAMSYIAVVCIVKWLLFLSIAEKKKEISNYQPVHLCAINEIIFTKQYSFHEDICRGKVDIIYKILLEAERLRNSRFEVFRKIGVTLLIRKSLNNFIRKVHFLVRTQITGLQRW